MRADLLVVVIFLVIVTAWAVSVSVILSTKRNSGNKEGRVASKEEDVQEVAKQNTNLAKERAQPTLKQKHKAVPLPSKYPRIFQICLRPYVGVPEEFVQHIKKRNPRQSYSLIDDAAAIAFLRSHFDSRVVRAFQNGVTKWKADLLRFCLMSKFAGVYMDLDLQFARDVESLALPSVDCVLCIGAFEPKEGITPLPPGELAIGLIMARSPEPILFEFVESITPEVSASGKPYAVNIQGLYSFLAKRFDADVLEPYKVYRDATTDRTYYFLKEEIKGTENPKILDKNRNVFIESQFHDHMYFY